MNNRTLHENNDPDTPTLLSAIWVAMLLANLFRDVHEILRPGFVQELARDGTVYGTEVSNSTLLGSGFALVFLVSVVVLARVLPRRMNRWVNIVAAASLASGVLASWPKDPDDYVFGAALLIGATLVVAICVRWRDDGADSHDVSEWARDTTKTQRRPPLATR